MGLTDLLRGARVLGALARLMGRWRFASVLGLVVAVGYFGLGFNDAAGAVAVSDADHGAGAFSVTVLYIVCGAVALAGVGVLFYGDPVRGGAAGSDRSVDAPNGRRAGVRLGSVPRRGLRGQG